MQASLCSLLYVPSLWTDINTHAFYTPISLSMPISPSACMHSAHLIIHAFGYVYNMLVKMLSIVFLHIIHIAKMPAGCSHYTVRAARYGLARFVRFLEQEQVLRIEDLNHEIIAEYQQELYFCLTRCSSF